MKRLFSVLVLCAAPLLAQDLPPLMPVPLIPLTAAQPTAAQPAETPPAMPAAELKPVLAVPNNAIEDAARQVSAPGISNYIKPIPAPKKEIRYSEYKAAKRRLFEQMRASESMFRRSGYWFDFSVTSFNFSSYNYYSGSRHQRYRGFSHYGLYTSFGRVSKGFMSGVSLQYSFRDSFHRYGYDYSLPALYEVSGVLGYRIAPDRTVGFRIMMHVGYGSSIHGKQAQSPSGYSPVSYVLLMPEIKLDFKIYKALTLTLGLAYKGTVFVRGSRGYADTLQSELGFNGVRALRPSIGLSYNY